MTKSWAYHGVKSFIYKKPKSSTKPFGITINVKSAPLIPAYVTNIISKAEYVSSDNTANLVKEITDKYTSPNDLAILKKVYGDDFVQPAVIQALIKKGATVEDLQFKAGIYPIDLAANGIPLDMFDKNGAWGNPNMNNPVSTNGRCGALRVNGKYKHLRCPDGQCCSQFGWCGNKEDHCKRVPMIKSGAYHGVGSYVYKRPKSYQNLPS